MNQKNLNYEIETSISAFMDIKGHLLAMNQKNLNYEIETSQRWLCLTSSAGTMNQKNLNYEIETSTRNGRRRLLPRYESKESQL